MTRGRKILLLALSSSVLILPPAVLTAMDKTSAYASGANTAPIVELVLITPDAEPKSPGVQIINPDPGTPETVTVTAIISEPDGYGDIADVTATISGPGQVTKLNLVLNNVLSEETTDYTGSFQISTQSQGHYIVKVTARDEEGLSSTGLEVFKYIYGAAVNTVYDFSSDAITNKPAYDCQYITTNITEGILPRQSSKIYPN
jgi:hypothetical protein